MNYLTSQDGVPIKTANPLPVTGAVTVADGGDTAIGAKADAAATTDTGTFTLIALIKRLLQKWTAGVSITGSIPAGTNNIGDVDVLSINGASQAFSGASGSAAPAGAVMVGAYDGANLVAIRTIGAVGSDGATGQALAVEETLFNNATHDRRRNNTEASPVTSAARTTSSNSADITVYNGAMLAAFLDVTTASGTTPTLDVTVKVKDPASGKYFVVGTFTQATGATTQALFIGAGGDTEFITRTYRIEWVIAGTTPSFTFSVGAAATVA